ncbi:MAG TPA: DUF1343 domain-containing protein [bacterium]|nr:DUF1343 domain-containing protein [bacterium]HPN33461.1 DUF1343 domain-containing protein [bacterium]
MSILKLDVRMRRYSPRPTAWLLWLLAALWSGTSPAQVLTGLDVLAQQQFKPLHGKRVGLVINHTAVDRNGRSIIELLAACPLVRVASFFTPEHGLSGRREAGETIHSQIDSSTGAPIYSLYGDINKPTMEMLRGLDVLVFDIQDIGARFYTYISTLFLAMEAAAESRVDFMVLDRPNPIGGALVEGPVLKKAFTSFVGIQPIALRHGMTIGELARLFNGQKWLSGGLRLNLTVVPMKGWQRDMLFAETGLPWIAPSPNIPSMHAALVYPGICLLEATNLSEGRGTTEPFEQFGAPWLDSEALMQSLQADSTVIRVCRADFTPVSIPGMAMNPKYLNRRCQGVKLQVRQAHVFYSVAFGLKVLSAVRRLHPDSLQFSEGGMNRLAGDDEVLLGLRLGRSSEQILESGRGEMRKFLRMRKKYLLY